MKWYKNFWLWVLLIWVVLFVGLLLFDFAVGKRWDSELSALTSGVVLIGAMLLVLYLTERREERSMRESELVAIEMEARKPFVEAIVHLIRIEDVLKVHLHRIGRKEKSKTIYEMLEFSYPEDSRGQLGHFDAMVERYFGARLDEHFRAQLGNQIQGIKERDKGLESMHYRLGKELRPDHDNSELNPSRYLPASLRALLDLAQAAYNKSRSGSQAGDSNALFSRAKDAADLLTSFNAELRKQLRSKGFGRTFDEITGKVKKN